MAVQLGIDAKQQQVLRVESNVDAAQVMQRAKKESRADDQDKRDGYLRDQERLAERAAGSDNGSAVFLQGRAEVDAGAAKRRGDTEKDSGSAGHDQNEGQNPLACHRIRRACRGSLVMKF